jgi:hypothetical protein
LGALVWLKEEKSGTYDRASAMLILLEMLMQEGHNRGHLLSCEQPDHLAIDEAKGGGPIQL